MFPRTDSLRKNSQKPIDMFPRTDTIKKWPADINSINSSHVEFVVLMSRIDK